MCATWFAAGQVEHREVNSFFSPASELAQLSSMGDGQQFKYKKRQNMIVHVCERVSTATLMLNKRLPTWDGRNVSACSMRSLISLFE